MKNEINLIGITGRKQMGKNTVANIIQELTPHLPTMEIKRGGTYTLWQQKSFAHKLKQIASLILNIPVEDFEKEEIKKRLLPKEWDIMTSKTEEVMSVRGFLQKLGTEVGRQLHPEVWINALFSEYKPSHIKIGEDDSEEYKDVLPKWIITDVRFPNEIKAIKDRGGISIRVFRPGKLRVWYNDCGNSDEEDFSGYYYVQNIQEGVFSLTEYADGKGSAVDASDEEITFDDSDNHLSETALDNYTFDEVIINDGNIDSLNEKVKQVLIKHKII